MFKAKKTKHRRGIPTPQAFIIAFILFMASTLWGLYIIDRGITPALMQIAKTQAEQVASYAINYGISKEAIDNLGEDLKKKPQAANEGQLIIKTLDNDKNVTFVTFDTMRINKALVDIKNRIQWFLRNVENGSISISDGDLYQGSKSSTITGELEDIQYDPKHKGDGVIARVPLGQAMNNALLTNLGPTVPVRFGLISNVTTNAVPKQESLGINNTYLKVVLHVKVQVRVVTPFALKTVPVSQDILLDYAYVPGGVPIYYSKGSSGITPSLPLQKSPSSNGHD
jgi:sporulation protein YunB